MSLMHECEALSNVSPSKNMPARKSKVSELIMLMFKWQDGCIKVSQRLNIAPNYVALKRGLEPCPRDRAQQSRIIRVARRL